MCDAVQELKTRAEILHHQVTAGDAEACRRLRALADLVKVTTEAGADVKRKHCLLVVAREHGFATWEQARRVLDGSEPEADRGTLLYPAQGGALNVWFTNYDEARAHLDEARRGGEHRYLLPYKRQLLIVEGLFIEALGLDPDDADWEVIAFDWVRPRDLAAARRLYKRRIDAMRRDV